MTLVIAHRGASAAAPENTIAAFELAGSMGADGVELDVRRTADDRLVVHHDPALPDGRVIAEMLHGELPGDVSALDAALDACHGMFVNIEIKNDPSEPDFDPTDWVAVRLASELARRGETRRWLISSFRFETVAMMMRVAPDVRCAWLTMTLDDEVITSAAALGCDAVHPSVRSVDLASLRAAHTAGLAVNAWTCDDAARMTELMAWGIDGICTNVPDVALDVRRRGA